MAIRKGKRAPHSQSFEIMALLYKQAALSTLGANNMDAPDSGTLWKENASNMPELQPIPYKRECLLYLKRPVLAADQPPLLHATRKIPKHSHTQLCTPSA